MPEPQARPGSAPGARGGQSQAVPGPDRILLSGLRFMGSHGVLPEEAQRAQPFEVDLELWLDLAAAGQTDDLAATVDYGQLCEVARAVIEGARGKNSGLAGQFGWSRPPNAVCYPAQDEARDGLCS